MRAHRSTEKTSVASLACINRNRKKCFPYKGTPFTSFRAHGSMNYFFILELCCVRLHFKLHSINSPVLMLVLVCFWHPSLNVMNYSPHTLITLFVTATTVLLAKLQYSLNCIYPLFLQCLKDHLLISIQPMSGCHACIGRTCVRAPVLQSLHLPWRIVPRGLIPTVLCCCCCLLVIGSRKSVVGS